MIMPQLSTAEELERILATFHYGQAMVKSALYTLLYAIISLVLVVVHILSSIINFAIGVLTIVYGLVCMARLLLTLCQEIAAMGPQCAMIGNGRKF